MINLPFYSNVWGGETLSLSLTSSVTRGTVKGAPLFLLIFRACSVFSLNHTHIISNHRSDTPELHTWGGLTSRRFWRNIRYCQKNLPSDPWRCSRANQWPATIKTNVFSWAFFPVQLLQHKPFKTENIQLAYYVLIFSSPSKIFNSVKATQHSYYLHHFSFCTFFSVKLVPQFLSFFNNS